MLTRIEGQELLKCLKYLRKKLKNLNSGLVELLYSPKKPEKNLQVHKEHRLVLLLKLEIYYCFLNISQTKIGVIGSLLHRP